MFFHVTVSDYDFGALILRVTVGTLLATHGYPKLTSGLKSVHDWLAAAGIPGVLGPLVGVLEFAGGLSLVVGFLTPVVAALFVLEFLGIIATGKKLGKSKFGDYEKDLFFLGAALALVLLGGGKYSVDRLL